LTKNPGSGDAEDLRSIEPVMRATMDLSDSPSRKLWMREHFTERDERAFI
jgi:hypothetical protein